AADDQKQVEDGPDNENDEKDKSEDDSCPKEVNTARQHVNTSSPEVTTGRFKLNIVDPSVNTASSSDPDSPKYMFTMGASHTLEATHVEFFSDEDEPEVNLGNILNCYTFPTTPNTRIHNDHLITNVIGDVKSSIQTRRITKPTSEQGFLSAVWKLVDLPNEKRAIGTKWVFRNKKDERGIMIRNKARIKAIRLFLSYASFMGFLVYQMDVKSAFLYGTIEEEVYVTHPPGFKDPDHPDKVYKVYVDDIIFGSTNKELCTAFEKLMKDNQDKYVAEILKKFNYTYVKSASSPVDLEKPLVKDGDVDDVDIPSYTKDISSLNRKSTTGGCQFLGNRLISWQCKKQTVVATSTTEAKYVVAASCCGQVLWIQNQLLDYGYNFMNTVINIDNNSTICIIENPAQHSKTKYIEIRHHFIRDCNAKKLIQMVKIHTDYNVVDLLTKGFDAGRFQYLV
ncbi:putative ribonuclease H-like domain-containing protein, partial [Tanacetum coccineum]